MADITITKLGIMTCQEERDITKQKVCCAFLLWSQQLKILIATSVSLSFSALYKQHLIWFPVFMGNCSIWKYFILRMLIIYGFLGNSQMFLGKVEHSRFKKHSLRKWRSIFSLPVYYFKQVGISVTKSDEIACLLK